MQSEHCKLVQYWLVYYQVWLNQKTQQKGLIHWQYQLTKEVRYKQCETAGALDSITLNHHQYENHTEGKNLLRLKGKE